MGRGPASPSLPSGRETAASQACGWAALVMAKLCKQKFDRLGTEQIIALIDPGDRGRQIRGPTEHDDLQPLLSARRIHAPRRLLRARALDQRVGSAPFQSAGKRDATSADSKRHADRAGELARRILILTRRVFALRSSFAIRGCRSKNTSKRTTNLHSTSTLPRPFSLPPRSRRHRGCGVAISRNSTSR